VNAAFLERQLRSTQANLFRLQGRHQEAFAVDRELRTSIIRSGAKRMLHEALIFESLHHARYGSLEEAISLRREALALNEPDHYPAEFAWCVWELGDLYRLVGDHAAAKTHYEQAQAFFQKYNIHLGVGYTHRGWGLLAFGDGDFDRAREQFQLFLQYTSDHFWSEAYGRCYLGRTLARLQRFEEADASLAQGIEAAMAIGHHDLARIAHLGYAEIACRRNAWEKAVTLAAAVGQDFNTWHETRNEAQAIIEAASEHLSPEAVSKAIERGKALPFEDLLRVAES